jgi:aminoglycoside 3-N-acetyltransferase
MIKKFINLIVPHQKRYYKDRLFRRVNEKRLAEKLKQIGVGPGQVLYIQSSFGSLGYYKDGAIRLIHLLKQMVGQKGTIVMPSFPFNGAMEDYVATYPLYNARQTPSKIGMLPEVFRQLPNVRRSCHPTHPLAALGFSADEIVVGHENCDSPQGKDSPFDKLVKLGALVIRIGTPAFPLCHRLQEIVDWPNLFLPEKVTLDCANDAGQNIQVATRIYRKRIPFVFFLPGKDYRIPIPTNIIDFPTLSPMRAELLRNDPEKSIALPLMLEFRETLKREGHFMQTEYNKCILDSFPADYVMDFAIHKAKEMIQLFLDYYDLKKITQNMTTGRLKI